MDFVKAAAATLIRSLFPFWVEHPTAADRWLPRFGCGGLALFVAIWAANHWHILPEQYAGFAAEVSLACVTLYLITFILAGVRMASDNSKQRNQGLGSQTMQVSKKIGLYMFLPAAILSAAFLALLYFLHRLP